jgi:hypothetical protein
MDTVADTSLPGLAPEPSRQNAAAAIAAAVPDLRESNLHRIKDILVTVYAYGLLGFGLFFPFVLAAWAAFFVPAGQ